MEPSGLNATPNGLDPTVIAGPGALVATVIGVAVPDPPLMTYAVVPSGLNATPCGLDPTVIAGPDVFVATVIGVTVSDPKFATYA